MGAFEREEWVESIVLSPAERYIVHVRFDEPGDAVLVNRVQGIDHLGGAFFAETDTLGVVHVAAAEPGAGPGGTRGTASAAGAPGPAAIPTPAALAFDTLRTNLHAAREIALYREHFDDPVDHELTLHPGNIRNPGWCSRWGGRGRVTTRYRLAASIFC